METLVSMLTDSSSEKDQAQVHLKYFERRLSSEDLVDFTNALSNGSMQISNSHNEGLFKYWLDLSVFLVHRLVSILY